VSDTPDGTAGYRSSSRSRYVGSGDAFARVAAGLMAWDVHREAGFRIVEAPEIAVVGGTFVAHAPLFPVTSRCEVTAVIDEPDRRGFTYRTLPGHPLDGEETFLVERQNGGTVFTVSERSRPASMLTRLPGARWAQSRINDRYLGGAERIALNAR